jgi:tetratricopeptide (TPR) repeat protein
MPEGIQRMQLAWTSMTELLDGDPNNSALQREWVRTAMSLGNALADTNRYDQAVSVLQRAVRVTDGLLQADQENVQYRRDFALTADALAGVLEKKGKRGEGLAVAKRSLAAEEMVAKPDASADDHNTFALMLLNSPYPELHDAAKALSHARQAVEKGGGRDSTYLSTLGQALEENKDYDGALRVWQKARDLLPPGNASFKTRTEIDAYLLRVQRKLPR